MINWNKYIQNWINGASKPSGNHTSNLPLDNDLLNLLMENHVSIDSFNNSLFFKEIKFPKLDLNTNHVKGLNVLSGLQNINKPDCVSVYRAIRYPTPKRILQIVLDSGVSTINYEHQRLLKIYEDEEYRRKREQLKKDPRFSFQPQERIVPGLPIFFSVNDAIHIHRAYRSENDLIVVAVAFIPHAQLKNDSVEIFSNYALVQNYSDSDGDKKITHYRKLNTGRVVPFYKALNLEGNLVYETYCTGIPQSVSDSKTKGIEQRFFLIELYKPQIDSQIKTINGVFLSNDLMANDSYYLYGFWGDDNIFMRKPSEYLPNTIYEIIPK
jgi:hypothetical protein